jgi:Uma2 family endonuclease
MTELVLGGSIRVPYWVQDLPTFRKWTLSDDFPDEGEIAFLDGRLWVDPAMERDIHNQIKTVITIVLGSIIMAAKLGRFYGDNMRLVHPEAQLSTEPDAMFVMWESLQRRRVQLKLGNHSLELIGSPDMVLEVVSPTSVEKDTKHLVDLYYRAGVREYWLINPLGKTLDFKIYRRGTKKFSLVRHQDGWLQSAVFDRSFRLREESTDLELSEFVLETR